MMGLGLRVHRNAGLCFCRILGEPLFTVLLLFYEEALRLVLSQDFDKLLKYDGNHYIPNLYGIESTNPLARTVQGYSTYDIQQI